MSHVASPAPVRVENPVGADVLARHVASPSRRLRVLIVYTDLAGARLTMERLGRLIRESPAPTTVLHPLLWRVDQLDSARWQEASVADAVSADWVVFATKAAWTFAPEVNRWLGFVLARKAHEPLYLLALPNNETPWTISIEHSAEVHAAAAQLRQSTPPEDNEEYFAKSA
jgi:hypothetical protein